MSPTGRCHAVPWLKSMPRRILLKWIKIENLIWFSWLRNCSVTVCFEYGNGISGSVTHGGLLMFCWRYQICVLLGNYVVYFNQIRPVPVASLSKAQICGRSPADIVGSNPDEGMDVCCRCSVLSGRGPCGELITRSDESYRLWRVVVWCRNLKEGGGPGPLWAAAPRGGGGKKKKKANTEKKTKNSLNFTHPIKKRNSPH